MRRESIDAAPRDPSPTQFHFQPLMQGTGVFAGLGNVETTNLGELYHLTIAVSNLVQ